MPAAGGPPTASTNCLNQVRCVTPNALARVLATNSPALV